MQGCAHHPNVPDDVAVNFLQVRHAFGNYRDILKEVSYSPLMVS